MNRSTSTVLTVAAALAGAALPVFLLSALAPAIKDELGFGDTALGIAIAAFFIAGAAMSIPAGRFADRVGAAVALRVGLGIATLGNLAVALVAHSAVVLTAAMFLSGLAVAFVDTGGARAIASGIAPGRQGIAFGGKEASIPTASFLAGMSVPVIGAQFGWRPAFGIGVVACIGIGLAVSRHLEATPQGRQGTRTAARDADTSGDGGGDGGSGFALHDVVRLDPERSGVAPLDGEQADVARLDPERSGVQPLDREQPDPAASGPGRSDVSGLDGVRSDDRRSGDRDAPTVPHGPWPLALLSVTGALGGGAAASAASFLVASSVVMGRSPSVAGTVLATASAIAIASRLLVGLVADRRSSAAVGIVAGMVMAGSFGTAALGVAASNLDLTDGVALVTLVVGAVLAIGLGWGWTGLLFLAAVRLDPDRPARAAGITLLGLGLGGALGPAVFGTLADRVGFAGAWSAATGALVLASLTAIAAQRLGRPVSSASA